MVCCVWREASGLNFRGCGNNPVVVWVGAFNFFWKITYRNPVQKLTQNREFHEKCVSSGVGVLYVGGDGLLGFGSEIALPEAGFCDFYTLDVDLILFLYWIYRLSWC
jgi:hypothetical protein